MANISCISRTIIEHEPASQISSDGLLFLYPKFLRKDFKSGVLNDPYNENNLEAYQGVNIYLVFFVASRTVSKFTS